MVRCIMNANSSSEGQDTPDRNLVAVVNADEIRAENMRPDGLASIDDTALAAFLAFAWDAPGDWHRLPKSSFALRAIPTFRPARLTRFEIRRDDRAGLYRYEYDFRRNVLTYRRDNQVEHSEINPEHGLPNDPLEFALMVVASIRADPDSHAPDDFLGAAASRAKAMYTDSPAHGPLQDAVASIVDRMANQWFGPKAFEWEWRKRLGVALAGSGTFFGVLYTFVVLDPDSKYEWIRLSSSGEDVIPGVIYLGLAVMTFFFAWLVSWKNHSQGPIRLYLGGFLLPYLVWVLISNMPGIDINSTDQKSNSAASGQTEEGGT